MLTRIVTGNDLGVIVARCGLDPLLDDMIRDLRFALERFDYATTTTRDRAGFHYTEPNLGLVEWMPAMNNGRVVSIKTVGYHPTNPKQLGIPSVLATISLYDCTSGRLLGIVEGTVLTALRTGAASAIATDILAPDRPIALGLIGAGAQAITQAHAISRIRTVDQILAFDVDAATASSLARRLGFLEKPVEIVGPEYRSRLRTDVDVLCTATSVGIGEGPVIDDGEHHPWLHINAVGADFAGKLELPAAMLQRALVCPDVRTQCILEGECQQLMAEEIGPDLVQLVQGAEQYRKHRNQLTVFDSTGWALEDLVAAELILRRAEEFDAGALVNLQSIGGDPFDPYDALGRSF